MHVYQLLVDRKRQATSADDIGALLDEIAQIPAAEVASGAVPRELFAWLLRDDDTLLLLLIAQFFRQCHLPTEEKVQIASQLRTDDELVANELVGLWCDLLYETDTLAHVDFANPNVARQFNPDLAWSVKPDVLDGFLLYEHWPVFLHFVRLNTHPGGKFDQETLAKLPFDKYLEAAEAMARFPPAKLRFLTTNAVLRLLNADELINSELFGAKHAVLDELLAYPRPPEIKQWEQALEEEAEKMKGGYKRPDIDVATETL